VLYKSVAERGPWSSLSRWALESYLKSDVGKALLLYSRMADLGYEVAQSNAAWILDRYGDQSICMGESGFCTDMERHLHAHALWWQASEQGNEHAALLIGDAYYYGRVCISSVDLQNYISLVTICGKMLEALCDFICITFT
jgi:SEL1 protein